MAMLKTLKHKYSEKNYELKNHSDYEYFYNYSYEVLSDKEHILDIGCGIGRFLKQGGTRIFGIDFNFENLKEAEKLILLKNSGISKKTV